MPKLRQGRHTRYPMKSVASDLSASLGNATPKVSPPAFELDGTFHVSKVIPVAESVLTTASGAWAWQTDSTGRVLLDMSLDDRTELNHTCTDGHKCGKDRVS